MKLIVDGVETTREEFCNRNDGRIVNTYEVVPEARARYGDDAVVITTTPPTAHLPHVSRHAG